jgi:hypothetical protein
MIWAFDGSSMLSVLRRLCGQVSGVPSAVRDQSISRIRARLAARQERKDRQGRVSASTPVPPLSRVLGFRP